MTNHNYEVQIIQKEDKTEIIQFMRDYFLPDEPINKSIDLITEEKTKNEQLEEYLAIGYDNGMSTKALQNGKLVAFSINPIIERNQTQEKIEIGNKDFLTIYNFLNYMDEHSDPFREFPESNTAVTVSNIAVHPDFRGMGIARDLMLRALEAGKERGCGFMVVECSSHFTALALQKLGFRCIFTLPYKDYKVDGKIVFNTQPPHTDATVFVKKIL